MKNFEEMDVFMPGDESKAHMKTAYNVFAAMIRDCAQQLSDRKDLLGAAMFDYVPVGWTNLCKNYAVRFSYDEVADILYLVLFYIPLEEDDSDNVPLVFVNVSGTDNTLSFDVDSCAYIFMIAFINHLGVTYLETKESIQKES